MQEICISPFFIQVFQLQSATARSWLIMETSVADSVHFFLSGSANPVLKIRIRFNKNTDLDPDPNLYLAMFFDV